MPLKNYTSAELATHATLLAAQQDTSQHNGETNGQINSRLTAAAEALRAFKNQVGNRLVTDQAASFKAGTLGTSGIQNDGA